MAVAYTSPIQFYDKITAASVAYDVASNKVVIAFIPSDGSAINGFGCAIVGTIVGDNVTFGSIVIFKSSSTSNLSATYDSINSKIIIADNEGQAWVGTVSCDSGIPVEALIEFGPTQTFDGIGGFTTTDAEMISFNGKVAIAYKSISSGFGTVVVGTVTGDTITFGTPVTFDAVDIDEPFPLYDITNDKLVVTYNIDDTIDKGRGVVCTVTGNTVVPSTPVDFMDSLRVIHGASAYDETTGKIVIMANINYSPYITTISLGTVSGTTITFTPPEEVSDSTFSVEPSAVFNPSTGGVTFSYNDLDALLITTMNINPIGDDIKVVGPSSVIDTTGSYGDLASAYDSLNDRMIVVYHDNTIYEGRMILYDILPDFFWTNNKGHSERG